MPNLYHVYLAEDFPLDQQDCTLCVAESSREAEEYGREVFEEKLEANPELEVCAYEVSEVDGYKVVLEKGELLKKWEEMNG